MVQVQAARVCRKDVVMMMVCSMIYFVEKIWPLTTMALVFGKFSLSP